MEVYFYALLISVLVQVPFFAYAAIKQTDRFTDLSYSLTFLILCLWLWLAYAPSSSNPKLPIFLSLIMIWALRLGAYLVWRIQRIKKDTRFESIRGKPLQFSFFWTYQALMVWFCMLPILATLASLSEQITVTQKWQWPELLALIIWILGFSLEVVADFQKSVFKTKNPNTFIRSGIWKVSRHPNYLGEFLMWFAVLVFCLPSLQGIHFIAAITGILLFAFSLYQVSGVVLLEKQHIEKYGDAYRGYMQQTSLLLPIRFLLDFVPKGKK